MCVQKGGFGSPRDIINGQTVMAATVRDSTGPVSIANLSEPVEIKLNVIDVSNQVSLLLICVVYKQYYLQEEHNLDITNMYYVSWQTVGIH